MTPEEAKEQTLKYIEKEILWELSHHYVGGTIEIHLFGVIVTDELVSELSARFENWIVSYNSERPTRILLEAKS